MPRQQPPQVITDAVTAVAASAVMGIREGGALDYVISGTFDATVQLQRTLNGGASWDVVNTFTAAASGCIEKTVGQYRIVVPIYASGTVNYSLTKVFDVLKEYRSDDGVSALKVTEEGIDTPVRRSNGIRVSEMISVDVTCLASALDSAGKVNVMAAGTGLNATDSYKVRDITLVGGGTNFGAGGDRLISLTDGTTVWTTIANADLESAPAASLKWGNAKVPMLTGTSDTASVAGAQIYFAYSGGTTDHSATGSLKFNVLLEKVA